MRVVFQDLRLRRGSGWKPSAPEARPLSGGLSTGIDIRSYAHLLQQGKTAEAAEELLSRNPLPGLTCRVCPRFCESKCTRKGLDASVNVNALEQYLAEWLARRDVEPVPVTRAGRVAIVGSGAAGMAAAFFMRRKGYAVTVYEKERHPGGQFRTPEFADAQLPRSASSKPRASSSAAIPRWATVKPLPSDPCGPTTSRP